MELKNFVKKHNFFYSMYYYLFSFFVNFLKLFIKTDDKLILFVSYGGRHYSDSPMVIHKKMIEDERFKDCKIIWAFTNPSDYPNLNTVKIDTLKYYICAIKARCWITNVMVERALNFTGKHTFYFYTTHGVLVKLGGYDLPKGSSFTTKAKYKYDCSLAQSEEEAKYLSTQIGLPLDKIYLYGFPKNDVLANYTSEFRDSIREKLGIPKDKKAILYAPTFREYSGTMYDDFCINLELLEKELSNDYVLLYRAHPVVSDSSNVTSNFVINVSKYEVVEELMIASDLLISDYSGIIFDYSLMRKPTYLFVYDYEKYANFRGLYFDIRQELPHSETEQGIVDLIKAYDSKQQEIFDAFQLKYATYFGNATNQCLDLIYQEMQKKKK